MHHAGVADDPIVTEYLKSMILMGCMARPQEITEALLFLDSDYWLLPTGRKWPGRNMV